MVFCQLWGVNRAFYTIKNGSQTENHGHPPFAAISPNRRARLEPSTMALVHEPVIRPGSRLSVLFRPFSKVHIRLQAHPNDGLRCGIKERGRDRKKAKNYRI